MLSEFIRAPASGKKTSLVLQLFWLDDKRAVKWSFLETHRIDRARTPQTAASSTTSLSLPQNRYRSWDFLAGTLVFSKRTQAR